MSRLNTSNYYTLEPGSNFRLMLEHFRNQASGKGPNLYLKMPGQGRNSNCSLRYVSLAEKKAEGDMPKIEVVDSNEALNKRAASQLNRELTDKTAEQVPTAQSVSRPRKRKASKQASSTATAAKIVKRAKDLFDN